MISFEQALELIVQNVPSLQAEEVRLDQGVGRVLASDVLADVDSPPHRKSLMDGYAVRSQDINSGLIQLRIVETIYAGSWPQRPVVTGEAARIMTGAPLPSGADAVVMVEQTEILVPNESDKSRSGDDGVVQINVQHLESGKHVAHRADNFGKGQIIFPTGHRIRPWDVGLLAEVGASSIVTRRQPNVSLLATGSELVDCHLIPQRGQIRNSNGPMLASLTGALGLTFRQLPIAPDNESELSQLIRLGLDADLFLITGGVSAGMLDLVPRRLSEQGVTEIFHKVKIKPGKPIWFGVRQADRPTIVFGLPGNPVSSLVGFHLFVRTAIRLMEGSPHPLPSLLPGALAKEHETRGDRATFWPAKWSPNDCSVRQVEPLDWKGSSDLLTLGKADCLIYFSGEKNQHAAGQEVAVYPLSLESSL